MLRYRNNIYEAPYEHYLFPQLEKLDVVFGQAHGLLDRFLPKALTDLNITVDPKPNVNIEIFHLVSSAKNLENLETFSLIGGTPQAEEGADVRGIQDFIKLLPKRLKLKSFTIKDCTTTATLARQVATLPSLQKLSLDLRFIKPDPQDYKGPSPPTSTAIDALHKMCSVGLQELDFRVGPDLPLTLAPLSRFPELKALTILVYGARDPLTLEPLLHLPLLHTVHVHVPDMGALVTVDLFQALMHAWPHIKDLRLIDSGGDFQWLDPKRALLPITALGMVGARAPQMEFLEIQIDATCPAALPVPERAFPAGCTLHVHWEGGDEDYLIHTEAYLLLLCETLGSYGGTDLGTLWRNNPRGRVHGRPLCT